MVGNKFVDMLWIISLITNILQTNQEEYRKLIGDSTQLVHVTEGDIIHLQCTDQTLTEDHYIIWNRAILLNSDKTEIYRNGMLSTSDLGQEALAYSLNNSTEVEFTITIAQGLEQYLNLNVYKCQVIIATSTGDELIDITGSVLLEVRYPPPAPYPLCTSTGYQSDLIGQNVILTCRTQPGYPSITIQWWRNEIMVQSGSVEYNSNMRFTEYSLDYTFNLQQEDLEATYQCRVTWMEDITTCTVQETSQTTILPQQLSTSETTRHQTNNALISTDPEHNRVMTSISINKLTTPTIHRTTLKSECAMIADKSLTIELSLGAVIVLLILIIILLLYKRKHEDQTPNNGDQTMAGVTEVTDIYNKPIEMNTEHVFNDVAEEKEHVYNNVKGEKNKEHVYYNEPEDAVYINTTKS